MKEIFNSFKGKNRYIMFTVCLFIIAVGLGYFLFWQNPKLVAANIEKFLGNILRISRAMSSKSKLYVTGLIFQNNIKALLFMMFGGVFFGLVPFFAILFNGFAVGIVMAMNLYQGRSLAFILAAMLPHGILELPVIMLAASFGMKLGFELIFPYSKNRPKALKQNLKDSLLALGILVPLLFVAAAIEAMVTPYLAKKFI